MKTQSGRSMIEMLGVLAIIGVLSVGGLAGYTRAMRAHRANEALDYINRCYVDVRSKGDGISALDANGQPGTAADIDCTGTAGLGAGSNPSSVTAATCKRSAGGGTECSLTLASHDIAVAVGNKLGLAVVDEVTQLDRSANGTWSNHGG